MKKYLILYFSPTSAEERIGQADADKMKASMAEWMEWKDRHGDALVDFGSPVKPSKKLDKGKVEDDQGWTTGYSLIQAEDLDQAVEIMQDHPNFKDPDGPGIEILEYVSMPGMDE